MMTATQILALQEQQQRAERAALAAFEHDTLRVLAQEYENFCERRRREAMDEMIDIELGVGK